MATNALASSDFVSFVQRATQARKADPRQVARAGRNLIDGALRIRRGGDGLFGDVERPITKPAEAVGAWMSSLERDLADDDSFGRAAEMREALVAAAEEVDKAAATAPESAARLRSALYDDALGLVGAGRSRPMLPWLLAGVGVGALIGLLLASFGRRRR